jgi:hypothetical protein
LEIDLLISRIIAGCFRFAIDDSYYLVRQPNRLVRYKAQQIYEKAVREAELDGLLTDDEMLEMMRSQGIWQDSYDKSIETINKDIEELKIGIFKSFFKSKEKEIARNALASAKREVSRLISIRSSYSHMGSTGYAQIARTRYLVGSGLMDDSGKRIWKGDEFYDQNTSLLDDAVERYSASQISEQTMRFIARSGYWLSIWSCRGGCPDVFGRSAADLTDEQRHLMSWSQLYDSVQEHPNPPSSDVLADDDAFDGWMILKKRERERQKREASAESTISGMKLPDSGDIFLMAETEEDIKNIESLNGPQAAAIKKERLAHIASRGEVEEQNMPDSKREIQMMANRAGPSK